MTTSTTWGALLGTLLLLSAVLLAVSCNSCQSSKSTVPLEPYTQRSPVFDADSAYGHVETQVAFGPRVPGTAAHTACGDWLVAKLTGYGAQVQEQRAEVTPYDGQNLSIRNIIAAFFPDKEKRVLLFAHWDSRPFADEETDPQKRQQPIAGADDGASGVGVLLEIARHLQMQPTEVGVDIVFFDLEDWGPPAYSDDWVEGDWWCVGSRYWSEQPHVEGYRAAYGILLDMVGAAGATFPKEGYSTQYASNVVEKVWATATKLGYRNYFIPKQGGYITDDHLPVNQHHRAPSINVINLKSDTRTGFGVHWHTRNDDMRNIDRASLKAAGQTVMEVIYSE